MACTHLYGDIGSSVDIAWQQRYKIVIADRHRLYWLPTGRCSNTFLEIYTTLLSDVREGRCNSEKMLIFPPYILRRNSTARTAAEIKQVIWSWLQEWLCGKYNAMVNEPGPFSMYVIHGEGIT
jgi:hypothetical protein